MGLKADDSFLRFVSMGAVGSLAVMKHLRELGFDVIELERYSTCNKIWSTKVKRLRLPDLLCVRTGVRFEARGKSDLTIKMSHSPNNADRAWDAGLRDEDVVAFVKIWATGTTYRAGLPTYFDVGDLRAARATARQGSPKSAGEGAEVDLEWPSWSPTVGGRVTEVTAERITVIKANGKAQSYRLGDKHAYVVVGDTFDAEQCLLAGTVLKKSNVVTKLAQRWDVLDALSADSPLDRFSAAKAIPHLSLGKKGIDNLLRRLGEETEPRVKLEIAASLAKLDMEAGFAELSSQVSTPTEPYLRMEAVLVATEVGDQRARNLLIAVASSVGYSGQEVRQAAVWGLGESGCASYDDLIPFISDPETDVALHAICAFAKPLPPAVGAKLVQITLRGNPREQAAAREVLRRCAGKDEIRGLAAAIEADPAAETAALASLAVFPREHVQEADVKDQVIARLAPMRLLLDHRENWLASKGHLDSIAFLAGQSIHAAREER